MSFSYIYIYLIGTFSRARALADVVRDGDDAAADCDGDDGARRGC